MTDIDALIERLRDVRWPSGIMEDTAKDAAAALAELRDDREAWKRDCLAADRWCQKHEAEIAKLRERDKYCDEAFRYYEDSLDEVDAEIAKLREALEKIAYPPDDIDAPHYPVSIARSALGDKPEMGDGE